MLAPHGSDVRDDAPINRIYTPEYLHLILHSGLVVLSVFLVLPLCSSLDESLVGVCGDWVGMVTAKS